MASLTLITKVINDQLNDYNENHLVMNLILFKGHVIRISRDITSHNDHMLLVCVGSPGKQSLVRLSAGRIRCVPDYAYQLRRNGIQCRSCESVLASW